jgi:hypothetical protein
MGTEPTTFNTTMETIQNQLEAAKLVLSQAQTEYQHCFARGDWTACSKAKRKVAKCMKEVQYLVAQKLAVC